MKSKTSRRSDARGALYRALSLAFASCAVARVSGAVPLRVDLSPQNDRKDIVTPTCENWRVVEGEAISQKFGEVTVTFRKTGKVGTVIAADWWKAGLDTDATFASDGIFVKDGNNGGAIDMVVSGLAPGKHSVATFHSGMWADPMSSFNVAVNGEVKLKAVQPSSRIKEDYDTPCAYVEFESEAGKDVVLTFTPTGSGRINNVVINGFELDAPNPTLRASKPSPRNTDEHAEEKTVLEWAAPKSAKSHRIYIGTDRDAVANATPTSPECRGEVTEPKFQTTGLNTLDTYFWRVDTLDAKGSDAVATKGDIWSFRVRSLAFPGAEGYGRFARGGRGGKVYEVTTLEDGGPGSLREAVEAEGPRTVVFRVGGTIKLKDKLVIKNPYCTIAGQTAPGDGICIGGYTFGNYATHDTIIRYVRIRVGDESGKTMDGTGFASSDHCIMDHVSVSWSIDEAVSSRGARNITFQRSIVGEPLNVANHAKYQAGKGHGFAGSISGDIGSFHHNLVAHAAGRNWSLAGGLTKGGKFAGYLDIRNNVVYNWEHRTNDGGVRRLNLVGNYYIPGPATRVFHLLIAKHEMKLRDDFQRYFVSGNEMEGKPQYTADNWKNGCTIGDSSEEMGKMRLSEPFCEPYVTTQTAKQAYESVMADVGCNWPKYDAVDQRLLRDVAQRKATAKGSKTGTPGMIDSQKDVGGFPELKGGDAPPDADHDGMPDAWETQHKLNPNDPADGSIDPDGDGFTNLEDYLNGIVAPKQVNSSR